MCVHLGLQTSFKLNSRHVISHANNLPGYTTKQYNGIKYMCEMCEYGICILLGCTNDAKRILFATLRGRVCVCARHPKQIIYFIQRK